MGWTPFAQSEPPTRASFTVPQLSITLSLSSSFWPHGLFACWRWYRLSWIVFFLLIQGYAGPSLQAHVLSRAFPLRVLDHHTTLRELTSCVFTVSFFFTTYISRTFLILLYTPIILLWDGFLWPDSQWIWVR